jgi:apolipoprotein N-acyltransferase
MISRQFKRQWEGHPVLNALAFVLVIMCTVSVFWWVDENLNQYLYVLWKLVFLLASSVYLGFSCIGSFVTENLLSDYKCTGSIICVNFCNAYKCSVFCMGLIACMLALLFSMLTNEYTTY